MQKTTQKEKPRPLGHRAFQRHRDILKKNAKIRQKLVGVEVTEGDILRLSIERFNPRDV